MGGGRVEGKFYRGSDFRVGFWRMIRIFLGREGFLRRGSGLGVVFCLFVFWKV